MKNHSGSCGEWVIMDHQSPWVEYDKIIDAFCSRVTDSHITDYDYPVNKKNLQCDREGISNFNEKQIMTFFTAVVRGEQFGDGCMKQFVENRLALHALKRLEYLCNQK